MPREIVHVGRRIKVAVDTTTAADGSTIRRDVVLHPGAVVILPVLDADHVVLLRNHRFVVGETLWEVPAGTVEPPEPLEDCAKRELAEETGYTAARWTDLGVIHPVISYSTEAIYLFVAEGLEHVGARLDHGEFLEVLDMSVDELLAALDAGQITDAKTVAALLLYERRFVRR